MALYNTNTICSFSSSPIRSTDEFSFRNIQNRATSDSYIGPSVFSTKSPNPIRSSRLPPLVNFSESVMIKASRKELDDVLHELNSATSVQGKLLKHNLPTEVVDGLRDLRAKLSKNGMP